MPARSRSVLKRYHRACGWSAAGASPAARVTPQLLFSPLPFRRRLSLSAVVGVTHPSAPAQTAVTSTVLACGPFSPSSSAKRTSEPGFSFSNPPPSTLFL